MLQVASLAPIVLLATCIAANPVVIRGSPTGISLPISRKLNVKGNGTLDVVQRDKARRMSIANQFDSSTSSSPPSITLIDNVFVYVASVGIGSPASYCKSCQFLPGMVSYMPILDNLAVDTATANTWVGANQPYTMTSTSVETSDSVVSIVLRADGFLVKLELKLMNQKVTYGSGFFEGQ
jgi:cathepsin E